MLNVILRSCVIFCPFSLNKAIQYFDVLLFSFVVDVGNPTSVTFINTDTGQMASSYTSEKCVLFDIETAKPVITLSTEKSFGEFLDLYFN